MSFALPSGFVAQYQDIADSFVTDFGRPCRLIYPSLQQPCQNCITDPISHRSSNVYKTGGPSPFPQGSICPWCNGVGYFVTESSDNVTLRVYWKPKDFQRLGISLEKADSIIRVRGFLSDLPKLQRCQYLEVDSSIENYGVSRFKRFGEMVPYGLGVERYCLGYWEKVT